MPDLTEFLAQLDIRYLDDGTPVVSLACVASALGLPEAEVEQRLADIAGGDVITLQPDEVHRAS
jgi:hypothetical protein